MLLGALRSRRLVGLASRFIQPQFDHRNVRVHRREEIVERGLREIQFDLVQRFQRVAKVYQDQVALVPQLREKRRLDFSVA